MFTRYSTTPLFAYPNSTLLFWCTMNPVPPGPFTLEDAWTQVGNSGFFLFADQPAPLQNVVTAMGNPMNQPAVGTQGFLFLQVSEASAFCLTVSSGAIADDLTLGTATGLHQLSLKKGSPVIPGPGCQTFSILYPTNLPNAYPPEVSAAHPIVCNLLGPNAGQFQFTSFSPLNNFYYQWNNVLDPLDPNRSSSSLVPFAFELVPTGLEFPAFTINIPAGA